MSFDLNSPYIQICLSFDQFFKTGDITHLSNIPDEFTIDAFPIIHNLELAQEMQGIVATLWQYVIVWCKQYEATPLNNQELILNRREAYTLLLHVYIGMKMRFGEWNGKMKYYNIQSID